MHAEHTGVERFTPEGPVISGGMGTVCRARDGLTGELVALKSMRPTSRQSVDRFLREARVLAELRHPGIVRYVGHGWTPKGDLYLAMEWLEGEDLKERLDREPLSPLESVQLVTRVATALAAAHARRVVHRDIKPANIFLENGQPDRVKLLDFGLARLELETDDLTRTGDIVGTPLYMAPEQALASGIITTRADVYALATVFYRCLTGRAPFSGPSVAAVLAAKTNDEPPLLRAFCPEQPEELEVLLARMLARDPARRPADGAAVLGALLALGDPAAALASSRPARGELTEAEQRVVCVVAAATGLAAVTAGDSTAPALSVSDSLATMARRFGGELAWLGDGAPALLFAEQGVATDQATRAARCAMALRGMAPGMPIAVATGRGLATREAAAALRRAADGAAIRIDPVTAGLLDARFDVRGDDSGLLLWGEPEGGEPARAVLGRVTSFVGRDRELARLTAAFDECIGESLARVQLITAPPGMGKSRLCGELVRQRGGAVQVWIARGDPMRAGVPLGLLGEAVGSALGVASGQPIGERRDVLRSRVARRVAAAEVARVSEFLGELAGIPFPSEDSAQLLTARRDPMVMSEQVRRAWLDWVTAEAAAQPVLLVLDDLQWGDAATVKLVDAALRAAAELPLMVLGLARPEVHTLFPRLWSDRGLEEIHLGVLSRRASERLVAQVLGEDARRAAVARIIERAAGNPFFLEELIRHAAAGDDDHPPETVLAMVTGRIGGLPADARRFLRAASVFGEVFWVGGVKALLGADTLPDVVLDEQVAKLEERELVERRGAPRFPDERELRFRHSLVREAAYAMLTDEDRRRGHQLAAAWLEAVGETEAVVLADHHERGQDDGRALHWLVRAAEQALQRGDVEAVLARCAHRLARGATGEQLGALRAFEGEAHFWLSDLATGVPLALEAMAHLPPGSNLWFGATITIFLEAQEDQVRRVIQQMAEQPVMPPVGYLQTRAWMMASRACAVAGQTAVARFFHQRLLDVEPLLRGDPTARGFVFTEAFFWATYVEWDPWARVRATGLARDLFRSGSGVDVTMSEVLHGWTLLGLGQQAVAEPGVRAVVAGLTAAGVKGFMVDIGRVHHGLASLALGRLDEARASLDQAQASLFAGKNVLYGGIAQQGLAEVELDAGAPEAAESWAREAVSSLRPFPCLLIPALATLAQVLVARGRAGEALAATQEAFTILEATGHRIEGETKLRLAHAEALAAAGDQAGAQAAIRVARDHVLALAAAPGSDPALRDDFLTKVAENARTLERAREWSA